MSPVVDQSVRYELLNPRESYIVQAPAGSGKTELLTQRILALLAVVEKPENILAITFTRKAAAEMQSRVVSALLLAQKDEPTVAHEKYRWKLARKVLDRDIRKGWNLVENPSRLNVTTIDSLSASLSGALPLLSQTGALPKIAENARQYYLQAAENLLDSVTDQDEVAEDILSLLKHKDNNLNQVTELIAQMLSKRLQWMATISSHARQFSDESLINSLREVVEEKLLLIFQAMPTDIKTELPALLNQAAMILKANSKVNKPHLQRLGEVSHILEPCFEDLEIWQSIAELFLKATSKAQILTTFNARNGFPTEKDAIDETQKQAFKHNKKLVQEIAKQLASMEGMAEHLKEIKLLPTNIEQSVSQQSLKAAVALLPLAVAHLKLVFSRYNVIDFSELSLASLDALGHEDMPSDLALAMDYKLEHILIDEFQDTSTPQIELLKLLTAGWQDTTDRSLFLVGDPMQSIYRFRDANVSLFMQIRQNGIGHIKPQFRQLQVNFRSNRNIVEWVNQQFVEIMPKQEDLTYAAVSYAHSVAFNSSHDEAFVECWLTEDAADHIAEADKVIELVKMHIAENKQGNHKKSLAILARSRGNLIEIIRQLNQAGISFQAVEIDRLSQKMVVRDLLNLAFALGDQYDEISWAACMRSPWFGLSLNDIKTIFTKSEVERTILERINSQLRNLSQDGIERCEKILPLLKASVQQKGIKPYRKWLLGTFVAVGGLHQLDFEAERDDLLVCLDKLNELQEGAELNDRQLVDEAIDQLYAAPNPDADGEIQIMTIHKSKGLEFDTVILPRLDSGTRVGDHELLKWTEVLDRHGNSYNLLAISKQTGQQNDSVYQYISYLEKEKSRYEDQRVLYVAVTRAKQKLYLFGNVKLDEKNGEYKKPPSSSFLGMLWSGVENNFKTISAGTEKPLESESLYQSRQVKRVNLKHSLSVPIEETDNFIDSVQTLNEQRGPETVISDSAASVGTVLHRQLQWLSQRYQQGFELPENWPQITYAQVKASYHFRDEQSLKDAVSKVLDGIHRTLADPFGQKILTQWPEARSEWILHKKIDNGSFLTRVIDRSFVENDVRWIIDYKSSQPGENESFDSFIYNEKSLYLEQITDYFKMLAKLENRKIIAGLYFPLLSHFESVIES